MLPFVAIGLGLAAAANEVYFSCRRVSVREVAFSAAAEEARRLGRPLVVVGAPDGGPTMGPGCGDLTIDINPSSCPNSLIADVCKPLPIATDSCVVFCACVLELVSDVDAALAELRRISGGRVYLVRVEPWTLTAYLYPGARRTLPAALCVDAPRNWRPPAPRWGL